MRAGSAAALLTAVAALAWLGPPPGAFSPGGPAAMVASAQVVWTAWLNVSYRQPGSNETFRTVGESGVFGQDSPLRRVAGPLVAPDRPDGLNACNPHHTNFSRAPARGAWLALVQRGGGCTFAEKIRLAAEHRAAAVVIYNYAGGTGNDVQPMNHPGESRAGREGKGGADWARREPIADPGIGLGSLIGIGWAFRWRCSDGHVGVDAALLCVHKGPRWYVGTHMCVIYRHASYV